MKFRFHVYFFSIVHEISFLCLFQLRFRLFRLRLLLTFFIFFFTYESCDKWKYKILKMNIETCRINENETKNNKQKIFNNKTTILTTKKWKNIRNFFN